MHIIQHDSNKQRKIPHKTGSLPIFLFLSGSGFLDCNAACNVMPKKGINHKEHSLIEYLLIVFKTLYHLNEYLHLHSIQIWHVRKNIT